MHRHAGKGLEVLAARPSSSHQRFNAPGRNLPIGVGPGMTYIAEAVCASRQDT
ncbi:hypothetical protein HOE425_310081 [Hoeflea sp. EC-HK425]|nr:hypothetical protein HOE425_310081 [Hoeflea sp. EC-HK425]